MSRFNWLDWLATALVIIGGLNWGIIGIGYLLEASNPLVSWNLVQLLFGEFSDGLVEGLIYTIIGLAALYEIYVGYKFTDPDNHSSFSS